MCVHAGPASAFDNSRLSRNPCWKAVGGRAAGSLWAHASIGAARSECTKFSMVNTIFLLPFQRGMRFPLY
jgi:hypothetical protein